MSNSKIYFWSSWGRLFLLSSRQQSSWSEKCSFVGRRRGNIMNNENETCINHFFRGSKTLQQRINTLEWYSVMHQLTSIIIVTCIRVCGPKPREELLSFNGYHNK